VADPPPKKDIRIIFITNYVHASDPSTRRRLDYTLEVDSFLQDRRDGSILEKLHPLTPGDFGAVSRYYRLLGSIPQDAEQTVNGTT